MAFRLWRSLAGNLPGSEPAVGKLQNLAGVYGTIYLNFDEEIDRSFSDSSRWAGRGETISLTIGDSDFRMPPAINDALTSRIAHGVLGYDTRPASTIELITVRLKELYGWQIHEDWLVFLPGVVPGLNIGCRTLTSPGDTIISEVPIYYPFLAVADNSDRKLARLPAIRVNDRWVFNIDQFQSLASAPGHSALLLCNPQNPLGRVLTRNELLSIAEVCLSENVIVFSDEIHCDLLFDGHQHYPIAALGPEIADKSITLMSPTKAFAISGLGGAFAIIPGEELRRKFTKATAGIVPGFNAMSLVAMQAAYGECDDWLQAELEYLSRNRDYLIDGLKSVPGIKLTSPEAAYFLWLDFSHSGLNDPYQNLLDAGVELATGIEFGDERFLRLNFASPKRRLESALDRIRTALSN